MAKYINLGYSEVRQVPEGVFLLREYEPGKHCGQFIANDGTATTMQSSDVQRLLNNEEITTMKRYTEKQLQDMTNKQLLEIYNAKADKPLKKFQSKADGVKRVLAQQPAPSKKEKVRAKRKVNGERKARHNVQNDIRAYLLKSKKVTLDELVAEFPDTSPSTIRTKLSRLRTGRDCGEEGPLNLVKDGDYYKVAR